jgi:tellurium resistance protein TerD
MKKVVRLFKAILTFIGALLFCLFLINYTGLGDYVVLLVPKFESINEFTKHISVSICIGFAYFFASDLIKYKQNKISGESIQIYKPVLKYKLINILLGIVTFFILFQDIQSMQASKIILYLNFFIIGLFIFFPLLVYVFDLIKHRKDYLRLNSLEVAYCFDASEAKFNCQEITGIKYHEKTGFEEPYIEVNCVENNNHFLYLSKLNVDDSSLYQFLYEQSSLNDKLLSVISSENISTSNAKECVSNQFTIGVKYPESYNQSTLDLVAFVFDYSLEVLSENYFVYYNNRISPEDSLVHLNDKPLFQANESMNINLLKLPVFAKIIQIYVTSQPELNVETSNSTLTNEPLHVMLHDSVSGELIHDFAVSCNLNVKQAAEILVLYLDNNGWKIANSEKFIDGGIEALVDTYCAHLK